MYLRDGMSSNYTRSIAIIVIICALFVLFKAITYAKIAQTSK